MHRTLSSLGGFIPGMRVAVGIEQGQPWHAALSLPGEAVHCQASLDDVFVIPQLRGFNTGLSDSAWQNTEETPHWVF